MQQFFEEDEDERLQDWDIVLGDKALPKRGEKEFGPDGTEIQVDNLKNAREAMYRALEIPRGHYVKNKLEAIWCSERMESVVLAAKGPYFKDLGRQTNVGRRQIIWLNHLETVYLVERGSMSIYLDNGIVKQYLSEEIQVVEFELLFPMSLQHLYTVALDSTAMDKYLVFAYLKRQGYLIMEHIQRTPSLSQQLAQIENLGLLGPCAAYFKSFLQTRLLGNHSSLGFQNKHVFGYLLVYRALNVVPSYSSYESVSYPEISHYKIHFNVWKPQPNFSKKSPPLPDFHITVTNAKHTNFPSLADIQHLHNSLNHIITEEIAHEPVHVKQTSNKNHSIKKLEKAQRAQERLANMSKETRQNILYQKARQNMLKQGSTGRSIVLAVIDDGVISFISLLETDFTLSGNATKKLDKVKHSRNHGIMYTGN